MRRVRAVVAVVPMLLLVVGAAACQGSTSGTGTSASTRPAHTPSSSTSTATPSATTVPTTAPGPGPTASARPTASAPLTTGTTTLSPSTTAAGACAVTAAHRGVDLEVLPTTRRVVALTFDAGAAATGLPSILATLAAADVPATFFLTGRFAETYPAQARTVAAAYPVGNHTSTHPDLTTLPPTAVLDEVRHGAAAITSVTGVDPRPWFRFPYGARDARTIALVNDECDVPIRWTVDTLGWKGTSAGMTATMVRDRVLAALRPGEIVLMHVGANPADGSTLDAEALPSVIAAVRARGYGFVTLGDILGG